jgi:hypothetical protein
MEGFLREGFLEGRSLGRRPPNGANKKNDLELVEII